MEKKEKGLRLSKFCIPHEALKNSSYVVALALEGKIGIVCFFCLGTVLRNVPCVRDDKEYKKKLIEAAEEAGFKIVDNQSDDKYEIDRNWSKMQRYNVLPVMSLDYLINKYKGVADTVRLKCKELNDNGIFYLRNVRGDGNCYYRSVGYGYLELVIKKGPAFIQDLIKLYFLP